MNLMLQRPKVDKYNLTYMDAVLTPFYIDQDNSWDGTLFKNSISGLGGYKEPVKTIFEYYLGLSNRELIEKKEEKAKNSIESEELNSKISQLEGVINSYYQKNKVDKSASINLEDLQQELNEYIRITNNISSEIGKYTQNISVQKVDLDVKLQDVKELKKLSSLTKKAYNEIEHICTHCQSILTREQSLSRLELEDNRISINEKIEELNFEISESQKKLKNAEDELENLKSNFESYNDKISKIKKVDKIEEYISQKVLSELDNLKIELDIKRDRIVLINKELSAEMRRIKKELEINQENLNNQFNNLIHDLSEFLNVPSLFNREFGKFTKLKSGGTELNKECLSLFLIYEKLLAVNSNIKIPMTIDSFVKNEIDEENNSYMFSAIEKYFMNNDNQTFFAVIRENLQYFSAEFKERTFKITLEYPILKTDNYQSLSSQLINKLD